MKPWIVVIALGAVLCVSVVLHLTQYGQIGVLEARLDRFEKSTVKALAGNLVALERTLSHQWVLETLFLQSSEIRSTFALIKDYNARVKPGDCTNGQGDCNGQTTKLLRSKSVRHRTPLSTGAWTENVPLLPSSP